MHTIFPVACQTSGATRNWHTHTHTDTDTDTDTPTHPHMHKHHIHTNTRVRRYLPSTLYFDIYAVLLQLTVCRQACTVKQRFSLQSTQPLGFAPKGPIHTYRGYLDFSRTPQYRTMHVHVVNQPNISARSTAADSSHTTATHLHAHTTDLLLHTRTTAAYLHAHITDLLLHTHSTAAYLHAHTTDLLLHTHTTAANMWCGCAHQTKAHCIPHRATAACQHTTAAAQQLHAART